MDSSFLYLDDIMLQYDEDVVNRDFEKKLGKMKTHVGLSIHMGMSTTTLFVLRSVIFV